MDWVSSHDRRRTVLVPIRCAMWYVLEVIKATPVHTSVVAGHPLAEPLRDYALSLPEAYEDHPWGENVAKVGKKVFVFFGIPDADRSFGLTVKLPDSYEVAMSLTWAKNPGYGLDRGRWVWLTPPEDTPLDMLVDWITESYRAVAPKRLVRSLEPQSDA